MAAIFFQQNIARVVHLEVVQRGPLNTLIPNTCLQQPMSGGPQKRGIYTLYQREGLHIILGVIYISLAVYAKLSLFSHCQMNHLGMRLLSVWNLEMHVQHDLSLSVIALIVIYLIGHIVLSANSMQVAFYSIPIARKCKQLTSNQLNMNIETI